MEQAFASELYLCGFPLIFRAVPAHHLCFLVLVIVLAVTWLLVGWQGWEWHMWCSLVAILLFTSRWEDLYPDSNTFLSATTVPSCTLLSSAIVLTLHFLLVRSHTGRHVQKNGAISATIISIPTVCWQSRAKFFYTMVCFGHLAFC